MVVICNSIIPKIALFLNNYRMHKYLYKLFYASQIRVTGVTVEVQLAATDVNPFRYGITNLFIIYQTKLHLR